MYNPIEPELRRRLEDLFLAFDMDEGLPACRIMSTEGETYGLLPMHIAQQMMRIVEDYDLKLLPEDDGDDA
jgi:hypothetical protein